MPLSIAGDAPRGFASTCGKVQRSPNSLVTRSNFRRRPGTQRCALHFDGFLRCRRGLDPFAVFADQVLEALDGFGFGDVEFHRGLADVEVDLAGRAADVAEIGVGHFAGAVDDAAHDGDFDALEVDGGRLDARGGGLQIEERAAAGGAGDVIGLEDAGAGRLEDVVGEAQRLAGRGFALDEDGVADAVAEQRADVGRGVEQGGRGNRLEVGAGGEARP